MDLSSGDFGTPPPATDSVTTPPVAVVKPSDIPLDDDDDDIDETLSERLWGLTEMFPEVLRRSVGSLSSFTVKTTKAFFHYGKATAWIAASSASILILPVMFESERAQLQEQQIQQQRQILLGPNAAVSGSAGAGGLLPGAVPGVMPVQMQQR